MNHLPQCPLCVEIKDTDNVKICDYHADMLEFAEMPEVELCKEYCLN